MFCLRKLPHSKTRQRQCSSTGSGVCSLPGQLCLAPRFRGIRNSHHPLAQALRDTSPGVHSSHENLSNIPSHPAAFLGTTVLAISWCYPPSTYHIRNRCLVWHSALSRDQQIQVPLPVRTARKSYPPVSWAPNTPAGPKLLGIAVGLRGYPESEC